MPADLAFDALADPVRRQILGVLAEREECTVGELAERITSIGRTGVSSHLRVLRAAGLVTERKAGRFRHYSIDPAGPARDVIATLQALFQGALADAGRAATATGAAATDPDVQDGRSAG
ncbi:metalloregulator ArsR/SmtB family transcription factor [Streptomyces sp. NBC_00988]|uniref:ArsR/SmtB family transcription factor n=1 Tax=Streptomyces sp. NBC_00988 TaxID=2903704 RepID=UPI00386D4780|nr:metalloregulator ArsR/SmtB family transcription factor [Streptomyces sp. NBC_00988]